MHVTANSEAPAYLQQLVKWPADLIYIVL